MQGTYICYPCLTEELIDAGEVLISLDPEVYLVRQSEMARCKRCKQFTYWLKPDEIVEVAGC